MACSEEMAQCMLELLFNFCHRKEEEKKEEIYIFIKKNISTHRSEEAQHETVKCKMLLTHHIISIGTNYANVFNINKDHINPA